MTPGSRLGRERLHAELNVQHLHGLTLSWLKGLALVSGPVWLQCQWDVLPATPAFFLALAQGFCLTMAIGHGAIGSRWVRRAADLASLRPGAVVHAPWSAWHEVRSALWCGFGLVSAVPGIYLALERHIPMGLLSELTAAAATIFVLVVVAETASPVPQR